MSNTVGNGERTRGRKNDGKDVGEREGERDWRE